MKRYLDIINHFGIRNQMKKLNEECYEFLEAVDAYEDSLRELSEHGYSKDDTDLFMTEELRDAMIDEMGDVLLLLTQFIALYKIDKNVLDKHMDYKLNRTEKYIENILQKGGF